MCVMKATVSVLLVSEEGAAGLAQVRFRAAPNVRCFKKRKKKLTRMSKLGIFPSSDKNFDRSTICSLFLHFTLFSSRGLYFYLEEGGMALYFITQHVFKKGAL